MDNPLPFNRLGPYEILGCVSSEGTGLVYKAFDPRLARHVAIKVLAPELAASAEGVHRFLAAAAAAARVVHPNVVPLLDVAQDGPHYYVVMPWIEGDSLADRLEKDDGLPWSETIPIAQQMLAGIQAAHGVGTVHGNVRPENILIGRETGRAVLVGFRLGRALERESDAAATAHEDLRCFGAVIYRILTGQMPPEPPTHPADAASTQAGEAILRAQMPLDAPEGLASILARLFAPRPQDRYASAEAVVADLRALEPDGIGRGGTAPDASAAAAAEPDLSEWEARALGVHETLAIRWLRIIRGWALARLHAAWAKSHGVRRFLSRRRATGVALAGLAILIVLAAYPFYRWRRPAMNGSPATSLPADANVSPGLSRPQTEPAASAPAATTSIPAAREVRLPAPPIVPTVNYAAATLRAFGGPPPPYVLRFAGKQCVECELPGIHWEAYSMAYTGVLLARLSYHTRPARLVGNLDTRPGQESLAGWALSLVPATATQDSGAVPEKQSCLAFVYRAKGGQLRQLVGPPFDPRDQWWRITLAHERHTHRMTIASGETRHVDAVAEAMVCEHPSMRFWLGCPGFCEDEFSGEIGGFSLRANEDRAEPRLVVDRCTYLGLDFGRAPDGRVWDLSTGAHHGKLMGSQWKHTADRPLPAESVVKPAPGRAFAVRLQPQRGAELSETRGLAALSGTFTAELWIRGEPSFSGVLFGDWHPHYQGTPVLSYSGWQLEAGVGSSTLDFAFRVAYPLGRGRHGTLRTKGLPRDAKWHHVAFCNTPTDRQIYFDGKPLLDDETVQAAEILDHWAPSPRNLFIGARDFGGGWYQNDVRAVRLSSTRRYVREFVPPAELTKDAETLVLLDFSQHSTSPFVPDLSGAGHHAFMPQVTWMEVEKTWGP